MPASERQQNSCYTRNDCRQIKVRFSRVFEIAARWIAHRTSRPLLPFPNQPCPEQANCRQDCGVPETAGETVVEIGFRQSKRADQKITLWNITAEYLIRSRALGNYPWSFTHLISVGVNDLS